MANYQKAFQNALSVLDYLEREKSGKLKKEELELLRKQVEQQGRQLEANIERQKTLDQMQLIQQQIAEKQAETQNIIQNNARMEGAVQVFGTLYGGKETITPKEVDAARKLFKENYNLDISSWFQANTDKETGVVKDFRADTGESLFKQAQQKIESDNAMANKLNAAANGVRSEVDKLKLQLGEQPNDIEEAVAMLTYNDPGFRKKPLNEQVNELQDIAWGLPTTSTITSQIEKGTKKGFEDNMKGVLNQIDDLKLAQETYMKDFLTWPGKIKNFAIDVVLKAGTTTEQITGITEENREYARQFARFQGAVMRTHNRYVHDISGAQFSIKEIERYEKSLMNMKQNYEAFSAVFNDYTNFIKKSYRFAKIAIDKGLTGDAIGQEVDRLMQIGSDPTLTEEYRLQVGNELIKQYKSENKNATDQEALDYATMELLNRGYIQ